MKWLIEITTAKAWDFMWFESLQNQEELSLVRICMEKTIMKGSRKWSKLNEGKKKKRKEWEKQAIKL